MLGHKAVELLHLSLSKLNGASHRTAADVSAHYEISINVWTYNVCWIGIIYSSF